MPNLVGIGNSQVPTNAMLGGLAYQDSVGEIAIDKIKARTSDSAKAIFVYDTRKDSDGGAWRHRTQNLSWYNEGVSERRGARKEFPSVAVIVSEDTPAYKVTIYDGDDPNLSMWMQWIYVSNDPFLDYSTPGSHHLGNYAPLSLSAMNGIVCVGTLRPAGHLNNLNAGLREFHFIKDECFATNNDKRVKFPTSIADRNIVTTEYQQVSPNLLPPTPIVNSNVNGVAMTVLPNAPIDASTGLPVPTIAVATADGVSVIRDDGTVVDLTKSTNDIQRVHFQGSRLHINSSSIGAHWIYDIIPSTDSALDPTDGHFEYWDPNYTNLYNPAYIGWNNPSIAANYIGTTSHNGGVSGLTSFDYNKNNYTRSSVAFITSTYNTGHMVGDIKGAFLSDTDDTNVTGSELITNGTFDSDISSWSGGVQWTHTTNSVGGDASGKLMVFHTASTNIYISQTITTVSGQYYIISYRASSDTADKARVWIGGTYYDYIVDNNNGAFVHHSHTFKASSTSTEIRLYTNGASRSYWDDISVRTAELDRSINQKDLQVFGTVTKSAVATGAELVAYSGWSSSNYFRQPYNSDLDFGTGDWSFNFWINPNDSSSGSVIMSRWSYNVNNSTAGRIGIYFNSGNVRFDLTDDGGSSYQAIAGSNGIQDTTGWHMVNILRRGPNAEMWVDGKLDVRTALTSTSDGSYTNTSAILEIGHSPNMGAPDSGIELALIRISKSAPTAEQIEKMYNDEKCLYHKNAKCTLHGTSDEVTGLAFDDTNNILHVGTSSGRSEFQGLNRINNTTTAVTTAISASNEFVAEQ